MKNWGHGYPRDGLCETGTLGLQKPNRARAPVQMKVTGTASGTSGSGGICNNAPRLAKSVNACTAKNLPREQTDAIVLDALSERVFTPKRVSLMLTEPLRHQQQAKTAEDARLITPKNSNALRLVDRLYQAIEQGAVSIDETLRTRTQKLKARRCELLTEMAKLKDPGARRTPGECRHRQSLLPGARSASPIRRPASAKRTCGCWSMKSNSTATS